MATGSLSNYAENKILDHSLGTTTWVRPTTIYAALYLVTPSDAGGGTEVSASDYVRVPATFSAAANGATTNNADTRFPASGVTTNNWGTVVALGLHDAIVNGNLIWWGPVSANVVLNTGSFFVFSAGQLSISLD